MSIYMFGINFSEILLIFVIALIAFGPKQIPQIASKLGALIFSLRQYINKTKQEFYQQSGFNELNNTHQNLINTYNNIRGNISLNQSFELSENSFSLFNEEEMFYQPELDFARQPELFDEI